jgi:ubiquinone/menaquinone biosynthesis C-methylase UbiE
MTNQTGWHLTGTGPQAYERYIVAAWMGEWAQALVDTANLAEGEKVLDLACGTGIVARKAAPRVGQNGRIVGFDANDAMLRAARQFAEHEGLDRIDWRQGTASAIPFGRQAFDAILCQQGLQYFPDRPAALKEMARVLVPGGRLAISVWRSLDRYPSFMAFARAISTYFGEEALGPFHDACSLSDKEELRTLLSDAGFSNIRISLEVRTARFMSIEEFIPGYLAATPLVANIGAMPEAERAAMIRDVKDYLRDYTLDEGLAAPMECHVATAEKQQTARLDFLSAEMIGK